MAVAISSALLAALMRAARAAGEREVCGLLRGDAGRILRADACANVATDPATRFEIDPAALIGAHRDARREGAPAVLGHYHSHPRGTATPSATDALDAALDGALWLIVTVTSARLWRACDGGALHDRFDPVALVIEHADHVEKGFVAVQTRGADGAPAIVARSESP